MKVTINEEALSKLEELVAQQNAEGKDLRIYIAGFGWAGPSFGLALDKRNENDEIDDSHRLTFIAEKDVVEELGNFEIQYSELGFRILAENQSDSSCGSCSGSCS